ncbi:hypothetical protein H4R34_000894 [Dimargaris verticillata]|uniref:MARVEL domain-containing protein n=1 Tax=Dimargaris verticillata TaxID=2761393 RepID=A0A9W8EBG2_9FUNG|nr:hypothetical protein H4R34_000894 [Dimargaris verticillata]
MRFDLTKEETPRVRAGLYGMSLAFSLLTMVLGGVTIGKYTSNDALAWSNSSYNFIVFCGAFTFVIFALLLLATLKARNKGSGYLRWLILPSVETLTVSVLLAFWFIGSIAIAVTTKANSCNSSLHYTGSTSACHTARSTVAFSFINLFFVMLVESTLLRDFFERNRKSQHAFTSLSFASAPHHHTSDTDASAANGIGSSDKDKDQQQVAEVPDYPHPSHSHMDNSPNTSVTMPEPEFYPPAGGRSAVPPV